MSKGECKTSSTNDGRKRNRPHVGNPNSNVKCGGRPSPHRRKALSFSPPAGTMSGVEDKIVKFRHGHTSSMSSSGSVSLSSSSSSVVDPCSDSRSEPGGLECAAVRSLGEAVLGLRARWGREWAPGMLMVLTVWCSSWSDIREGGGSGVVTPEPRPSVDWRERGGIKGVLSGAGVGVCGLVSPSSICCEVTSLVTLAVVRSSSLAAAACRSCEIWIGRREQGTRDIPV